MTRRGVAMLLVLGATLVVTSAIGVTAASLTSRQRTVAIAEHARLTEDLLSAAEAITKRWLAREAPRATVDPGAPRPRVDIADVDVHGGSVRVTAYDLYGMMSSGATPTHPLWRASGTISSEEVFGARSLADLSNPEVPVHPAADRDELRIGERIAVFPGADTGPTTGNTVIININTAPKPLLNAALRLAQRGDIASILTSRAEGRPAPAPAAPTGQASGVSTDLTNSSPGDTAGLVRLVGRSTLWAVRVDARQGLVERSWWTIYQSRGRGWTILERHEIAD
ncbi:MAG: hypothetical protein AAGB48_08515 [Planctomycetota bacterium]